MYKIGILGGGQLGFFLAKAAMAKGHSVLFYLQSEDESANQLKASFIYGDKHDQEQLLAFFSQSDIVLLESEFYSYDLLFKLEKESGCTVYPRLDSYKKLWNKEEQKNFFSKINIPCTKYYLVKDLDDIQSLPFEGPYVVKLSYGGYDGYGNFEVEDKSALTAKVKNVFKNDLGHLIIEKKLEIKNEYASLLVKAKNDYLILSPCQTFQKNHICHLVNYPAVITQKKYNKILSIMDQIGKNLEGEGVFAFEFFETTDGFILVNEAAPRVHNSFHFSLEGMDRSQFDLMIEVATNNFKGEVNEVFPCLTMVNLLGKRLTQDYNLKLPEVSGDYTCAVHMYHKKDSKPGRKMGHITLYGQKDCLEFGEKLFEGYKL